MKSKYFQHSFLTHFHYSTFCFQQKWPPVHPDSSSHSNFPLQYQNVPEIVTHHETNPDYEKSTAFCTSIKSSQVAEVFWRTTVRYSS